MTFVALGAAAATAQQWQTAATLLGLGVLMLGWYAGLVRTHQCGGFAPTTPDGVCRNVRRGGLLRGCQVHEWWRVKRIIRVVTRADDPDALRREAHRQPQQTRRVGTLVEISIIKSEEPPGEKLMLWATVVGSAAGLLSFVVGAITLLAQLGII
jgi:hypothetical protein